MNREQYPLAALVALLMMVGLLLCAEPMPTPETSVASTSVVVEELPPPATNTPTEPTSAPSVAFYELTEEERELIERVVMAEAGAEPYEGQKAVAQCILNACILDGLRPAQVIKKYKYTDARPSPTEAVRSAVSAVFDEGEKVIDPEALFFYAPARVASTWHESQACVASIGGHRFFKEADQVGEN